MVLTRKDKRNIIWGCIIVLLIPIILSLLIHLPKLGCVAGEESDWIGFWGSYFGALITLLTLYITIQSNKNESDRQRLIEYNKRYARDITNAVCSLSISRIVDCYKQDRQNQIIESVDTTRLESYKLEISNTYNTLVILYPEAEETFIKQYETSKDTFIAFINLLVKKQCLLEAQYNIHEIERIKAENTRYASDTKNLENTVQTLWEAAQTITTTLIVK